MSDQGTRIVIYNLWEDDQGVLELDFDTDEHVQFSSLLCCILLKPLVLYKFKLYSSLLRRFLNKIVILDQWWNCLAFLGLAFVNTDSKHSLSCQDIQLGGVNRDEKKIEMATEFPNSKHFLTYRHSLRVTTFSYFFVG